MEYKNNTQNNSNPQGKDRKSSQSNGSQSPHASISFTAHYTGHMWQKLGLSHPALATKTGKRLHQLVAPLDALSKTFFGVTLAHTLTVRHSMIDKRAKLFIEKHPDTQVVEIAAGLSPRGWRFVHLFDDISYAELDLPDMSALKVQRAQGLPHPIPKFIAADVFGDAFDDFLNSLDTERPLLIITEGLINYFSLDLLGSLSRTLSTHFKRFDHALWLTENYPLSDSKATSWLIKQSSAILKTLSKSAFSFYFHTPTEAANFFKKHGFITVDVYQPSSVYGSMQPENAIHAGDTVWVLEIR